MKNPFKHGAALLALLTLLAAGCSSGSGKEQQATVQPIAVSVTEAKTGTLTAAHTASGQIEPQLSVYVTAKMSGRAVAVHKQMGDAVKQGDLLVEIEDRDASAQLLQARASLAQAEAQRGEAERQYARLSDLLKSGAVSKQAVEQVQTQLALATAQVTAARGSVELAEANFDRTRVTAPATGILAARSVEPGAMVSAGSPLFQLVDLTTVVVKTGLPEREINSVPTGTKVPVLVSALNKEFEGTVEAISPNMDRQTRSYQVRVVLPNPAGTLKGGMFAQVRFPVTQKEGIVLPVAAVLERNGESVVYLVEGTKARPQPVTVLVTTTDKVLVDGLKAGAQVVTAGQNRLYDQAPVKVGGGASK